MQCFELGMQHRQLHQSVGRVRVDVPLPGGHGLRQPVRADRHEHGLIDRAARRPDPVGDAAELAGRLALSTDPAHQHCVGLADHPQGQGEFRQQLLGPPQSAAIVQHFLEVVAAGWGVRCLPGLESQHVAYRGHGALDARREDRFLGGQGRDENVRVGHGAKHPVVARQRRRGRADEGNQRRPVETLVGRELARVIVNSHHSPLWSTTVRAPPRRPRPRSLLRSHPGCGSSPTEKSSAGVGAGSAHLSHVDYRSLSSGND